MQVRLPSVTNKAISSDSSKDRTGVVFTKPWIVELMLDLAGYTAKSDLASLHAVEPAAGEGAFLIPMALRLRESARMRKRHALDCKGSLVAYELREDNAILGSKLTRGIAVNVI